MYSIVYKIFFGLKRWEKKLKEKQIFANARRVKAIRFLVGYIEAYYNLHIVNHYRKHPSDEWGVTEKKREQQIIISLTTYPKRISTVWITIETLLRQSVKPDQIILWLADSQFDGIDQLPSELLNLQKRGLTIRFCDDLRSHKKYFYAMQEYANEIIVLADDDIMYPYDTLEKLLRMHKKYPDNICTITGQALIHGELPSKWGNPKLKDRYENSDSIQIFTGSGSLYPPNSLDSRAFDKDLMKKLCPYADDLWLTYMALKKQTKISTLFPWRAFPVMIYGTSEETLWKINAEDGMNDQQWEAMEQNVR